MALHLRREVWDRKREVGGWTGIPQEKERGRKLCKGEEPSEGDKETGRFYRGSVDEAQAESLWRSASSNTF